IWGRRISRAWRAGVGGDFKSAARSAWRTRPLWRRMDDVGGESGEERGADGNAIPAKAYEGVGLHEAQEPFDGDERNNGGDNGGGDDHGPILLHRGRRGSGADGGFRGMVVMVAMEGLEDFQAAGGEHGWDADQKG